jgi:hypothetical protein
MSLTEGLQMGDLGRCLWLHEAEAGFLEKGLLFLEVGRASRRKKQGEHEDQ